MIDVCPICKVGEFQGVDHQTSWCGQCGTVRLDGATIQVPFHAKTTPSTRTHRLQAENAALIRALAAKLAFEIEDHERPDGDQHIALSWTLSKREIAACRGDTTALREGIVIAITKQLREFLHLPLND